MPRPMLASCGEKEDACDPTGRERVVPRGRTVSLLRIVGVWKTKYS